jgi:hypothetical protein
MHHLPLLKNRNYKHHLTYFDLIIKLALFNDFNCFHDSSFLDMRHLRLWVRA